MPRDVFPREDDRRVLHMALIKHPQSFESDVLAWSGSVLKIADAAGPVVAFYDSVGALCAKLLAGAAYHPSERVVNAIADMLGNTQDRVVREDRGWSTFNVSASLAPIETRVFAHFFAGNPVQIDEPFVIAGPLGLSAWRAAQSKGKK